MVRIKRGTQSLKTRKSLLKKVKGYRWGRSKKERQAREALFHAGAYAFAHRRKKKGDFRKLWTVRISAGLQPHDMSYSSFIHRLKQNNSPINRKMLATLAKEHKDIFDRVVKQTSDATAGE